MLTRTLSPFEQKIEVEYFRQMLDHYEAAKDYDAALPHDLRVNGWRRSLRSFTFFHSAYLFDDERSFEFMYRERYRMHADPVRNRFP